jgi:ketosteroid isomerase-like protein
MSTHMLGKVWLRCVICGTPVGLDSCRTAISLCKAVNVRKSAVVSSSAGDHMKSKSATDSSGALAATRLGISSNEDTNAIESVLRQYVSLLDAGDADSISTKIYKAPILFLALDGTHTTFPDTEAISKFLKSYLDTQATSGRTGTEIERIQIKLLSENVALAFVDYLIKRTDGNTKAGWFYIFQKEAGSWRAASLAPRDLPTTVAREGL